MNKNTIGYLIIVILLIATSAISIKLFFYEKAAHDKLDINKFPVEIGDWKGRSLEVTEQEYKILETRNLINREYVNASGERIVLFIIYSETNRSVFHPPEVCLIGSGITIVNKQPERVGSYKNSFLTNRLFLEKGGRKEMILYSYKCGNLYTDNFYLQQTYLIVNQVFGRRVPGATIRISAPVGRGESRTLAMLKGFLLKTTSLVDSLSSK